MARGNDTSKREIRSNIRNLRADLPSRLAYSGSGADFAAAMQSGNGHEKQSCQCLQPFLMGAGPCQP